MNEEKVKQLLNNEEYIKNIEYNYEKKNNIQTLKFTINRKPENYVRERSGRGNHFYNPKGNIIKEYKNEMLHQMNKEEYNYTRKLLKKENYSLEVKCYFYIQTQKASSIENAVLKEKGIIRPIGRPDIDNYTKFILDAMHDVVYDDDSKVVSIIGEKYYSMTPRTEIYIKIIERD